MIYMRMILLAAFAVVSTATFSACGEESSTALQNAAHSACEHSLECAREDGIEVDRDTQCSESDGYLVAARILGPACKRAMTDYLNCQASAPCDANNYCSEEANDLDKTCSIQ